MVYAPSQPTTVRRRTGLIVGLVIAAVVVVAVAGSIGYAASSRSHRAVPHVDTGPHDGDMRRFLVPMPADAKPIDQPLGVDGVVSFTDDVDHADDSNGRRTLLQIEGFEAEVIRQWRVGDMQVDVRLIRLTTPKQAADLILDQFGGFMARGMTNHNIPGIEQGIAFVAKYRYDGVLKTDSFGVRGDVMIQVETRQTTAPIDITTPNSILADQYARL
jgi:hypothetical protein